MSVEWRCDRCSVKHNDKGAMVSYPPQSWEAYQLTKVNKEHGKDFSSLSISIVHVCSHCITALKSLNKEPEIKFP